MVSVTLVRKLGHDLIKRSTTLPTGFITAALASSLSTFALECNTSLNKTSTLRNYLMPMTAKHFSSMPAEESSNSSLKGDDVSSKKISTPKVMRLSDVPISEVLKAKNALRYVDPVITKDSTVHEAIETCIDRGLSGMMVVETADTNSTENSLVGGKVVGMATSRDLLRIINSGLKDGDSPDEILKKKVGEYMTPISQVIFARPEETVKMCRSIMAKLGVKCLPILSNGTVEGLVTARDISNYGLDAKDRGGKKHYLESVSERVGMGSNTSMAEPPSYMTENEYSMHQEHIYANISVSELPHPYKKSTSCGMNRRDFGPDEVTMDSELSEDANFIAEVKLSDESGLETRELVYAGVADGVGSWREFGIDPREFSHKLMMECENILLESSCDKNDLNQKCKAEQKQKKPIMTPAELMGKAYGRLKEDNIIGSSTACVALFDGLRHQLHFSNLGDSGIIVLRHIDSNVAGTLKRDRTTPRHQRQSDLRVAFVSQQQLKSFNHPYQLGWTGEDIDIEDTSFKNACESCTTSIHIRPGDLIVMATDGLFDNVELDDINKIALEWEKKHNFVRNGDVCQTTMALESSKAVQDLSMTLVERARENSLDNTTDSPFAMLAKENDIMWSGGMPDDCTVIAMQIVGQPKSVAL